VTIAVVSGLFKNGEFPFREALCGLVHSNTLHKFYEKVVNKNIWEN